MKRYITIENNDVLFRFPYDPEMINEIKSLGKAHWNKQQRAWVLPLNQETVNFATDYDFEGVETAIKQLNYKLFASQAQEGEIYIPGLKKELRPFQKAAVIYAQDKKALLIADQPGLGKTIETLAILEEKKTFPALIVAPASVIYNWVNETKNWLDHRVDIYPKVEEITITSYERFNRAQQADELNHFKAIIFDESHYLKNPKAQRSKSALKAAKNKSLVLLLTGTPVVNRPADLIQQLKIMGMLNAFGGWEHFTSYYCNGRHEPWGYDISGAAHLDELNKTLRETCFIRREKKDVLTELPDKTINPINIQINNMSSYRQVEEDLLSWVAKEERKKVQKYHELKSSNPEEQEIAKKELLRMQAAVKAEELVKLQALKLECARGKIAMSLEWIENFLTSGEPLVVFAHHTEIIEAIKEKTNALSIQGKDTPQQRQQTIDDFQAGKNPLIICSLQAGGIGINLQKASNALFIELGWTPAEHEQAEDRLHRMGQKWPVTINYLLGQNTIDNTIWELLNKKRTISNIITAKINPSDIIKEIRQKARK